MKTSFRELVSNTVVLISILCWTTAIGQSKVFHEVFTSRDGLSIDNIKDIIQDENGYLWIVGNNLNNREIIAKPSSISLQRFDGKNFHNIKQPFLSDHTDINKFTSFTRSNFVVHAGDDLKNKSLSVFNPFTSSFKTVDIAGLKNVSDVRFIDGTYYILATMGTNVDVFALGKTGEWIEKFTVVNEVTSIDVNRNTVFLSFKNYYIFSDNNFPITITNKQGELVKKFPYEGFNRSRGLIANKLWIEEAFIKDNKLYAFMNNDDKLYSFNEEELRFVPVYDSYFKGKSSLKTFVDSKGNVLIAFTQNGFLHLVTLDQQGFITPLYRHLIDGTSSIQIWSKDIEDELWIAAGKDLHYYRFPNNQFNKYLVDEQLRAISHLGNQEYMVATEKGQWYKYNHLKKTVVEFPLFENGMPIVLGSSRNIFVEQDTLWSQSSGYIVAVNKNNGGSRSYRHYPSQCLEELNDSILIYGTKRYNLMSFNKNTRTHVPIVQTDSLDLLDVAIDGNSQWIVCATQKGVFSYNIKTHKAQLHDTGLKDNYLLVADYHKEYGFLLGTRDGVITQFDPQEESFNVIYKDELNAGIATITPYQNDLWINTFNGLVHFNEKGNSTRRYSTNDGLSNNEGNRYSASTTNNGILLGNILGLNHFIPSELVAKQSSDSLRLLKVRKYDSQQNKFVVDFDQHAFAKAKKIHLPVENKLLELDFSLTGLDVLRNESYEYKMNNEEWSSLGEVKKIQFLNLAAGDYNLEIRAKDFSGKVIGKTLKIDIVSEDFFYNKWWFYMLLGLFILIVLLWFLDQERIKSLMQVKFSQDLIQNQEKERSRIAKELHDSVGQQLTLIKQKAQTQKLDSIAQLTNNTLEEVRSISRNLYPVIIKQLGLKGAIDHLLLQIDEETELFVSVMVDDIDDCFTIDESLNIYRFIQECVSNVLKHASATTIEVEVEQKNKQVHIHIRDNGKGFNVSNKEDNNSLGLKTLQERIRILNGELEIRSLINSGTSTIANIPIK